MANEANKTPASDIERALESQSTVGKKLCELYKARKGKSPAVITSIGTSSVGKTQNIANVSELFRDAPAGAFDSIRAGIAGSKSVKGKPATVMCPDVEFGHLSGHASREELLQWAHDKGIPTQVRPLDPAGYQGYDGPGGLFLNPSASEPVGENKPVVLFDDYEEKAEMQRKGHYGQKAVKIGDCEVFPAGLQYLQSGDLDGDNVVLIPLADSGYYHNFEFGKFYEGHTFDEGEADPMFTVGHKYDILCAHLPDFGGVTPNWESFIKDTAVPLLKQGKKVIPFCFASQGRTGTFLASLVAVLESAEQTPDPIAAIRERHNSHAVETVKQADAIFALRRAATPKFYKGSLR